MQSKATLMVLVLLSGTIAGCTGDPDGGGNDDFDSDALQDLFDEHFQDFVNNTTITVNNHYHNNTTVVNNDYDTNNEYSNTTNVDGGEITNYNQFNGSGASDSIMQMFTVNWAHSDIQLFDYGSRIVTLNDTLQQTTGNPYLLYALVYEGNLIEFENVNCEQFYNFAWMDHEDWEDYLEETFGGDADTPGHQLENFWREYAWYSDSTANAAGETVRAQCLGLYGAEYQYYYTTVFEIELSPGEALQFLSIPDLFDIVMECDDGYESSANNGSIVNYLGGQADCTISGVAQMRVKHDYEREFWWDGVENSNNNSNNGSSNSNNGNSASNNIDTSNIPDWWSDYGSCRYSNNECWFFYTGTHFDSYSSTPTEFAVYFTTYFVEVYDEGSE